MSPKLCLKLAFFLVLFSFVPSLTSAQVSNVQSRIGRAIDEKNLVTLKGNTHSLATAEFDRGEAPASLPMSRMLLVLQHTTAQEAAIKQLLADQQNQSSPRFQQWLTPQQYGQMFGPSEQDVKSITSWLQSHGFDVANASPGGHVIEFSGTAGQVQGAFHTSIHHYVVNGEDHWANSSDPQIPAALASVVSGVKSLHNFRAQPNSNFAGLFQRDKSTGSTKQTSGPKFTFTTPNGTFFGVGPADFATIYNVTPLWNAGIDGTGENIAIVQESNINIQDIRNFRALFALPAKDPEIVIDGPDPGIVLSVEPEAVIDVTWAGAVAKGAKIKLVVSASTNTTEGIALSAVYIADHNIASISSMSFGQCELHLGTAGNQFWNAVWEQAAAEGISAFVSAGDGGSAGCDNFNRAAEARDGLAISGDASTPFDIAVGVHNIRATYDGDLSFLPSEAQPVSFTITKGVTATTVAASGAMAVQGASVTLTATVNTSSFGNPPAGSVKFTLGGKSLGPPVPVTGTNDPNTGLASATASISTTSLPLGPDTGTATYSGDKNYDGSNGTGSVTITAPAAPAN